MILNWRTEVADQSDADDSDLVVVTAGLPLMLLKLEIYKMKLPLSFALRAI